MHTGTLPGHALDVRECLAKHMKYKASSFYFYFPPNSPTEVIRHKIWYDDAE